jgi:hypothetical protein
MRYAGGSNAGGVYIIWYDKRTHRLRVGSGARWGSVYAVTGARTARAAVRPAFTQSGTPTPV